MRKDLVEKNDLLLAELLIILDAAFSSDYEKMKKWVSTPHSDLSSGRPIDYIAAGNIEKVLNVAKNTRGII